MPLKWIFLILSVLQLVTIQPYAEEINKNCIEHTTNISVFLKCLSNREKREVLNCDKCCSCKSNQCETFCSSKCQTDNCHRNCYDCNQKCDTLCGSQNFIPSRNCCLNNNCNEKPKPINCFNISRTDGTSGIIYEAKQKNDINEVETSTLVCDDCESDETPGMTEIYFPQTIHPSSTYVNHSDITNLNVHSNSSLQNNVSLNQSYHIISTLNNNNNINIPVFANATNVNKVSVNVTYPIYALFDGKGNVLQNRNSTSFSNQNFGSTSFTATQFPKVPITDNFFQTYPYMTSFFGHRGTDSQINNISELYKKFNITFESEESTLSTPELKQVNHSRINLLTGFQTHPETNINKVQWAYTAPSSEMKLTHPIINDHKITKIPDCQQSTIPLTEIKPEFHWEPSLNLAEFQSRNHPTPYVFPWHQSQRSEIKFDDSQFNVNQFPWTNTHPLQNQYPIDTKLNGIQWFQPQSSNIHFQGVQSNAHELQWPYPLIEDKKIHSFHTQLNTPDWPKSEINLHNMNLNLDTSFWPDTQVSDINTQNIQSNIGNFQWPHLHTPEINLQNVQPKLDHFQWSQPSTIGNPSTEIKWDPNRLYWSQNKIPGFSGFRNNDQLSELASVDQKITGEIPLSSNLDSSIQPLVHPNTWIKNCCIMIRPNCNYTVTPPFVECTKPTKFWTCGMQCFHNYLDGSMYRSPINCIGTYCKNIPSKDLLSDHYPKKNSFKKSIDDILDDK